MNEKKLIMEFSKILCLKNLPCSSDILARVWGIDKRRVQQLVVEGVIPPPKERGIYDFHACNGAYREYKTKLAEGAGNQETINQKERREKLRADREELRLEIDRKNLVSRGQAVQWLCNHIAIARSALMGYEGRMAPVLAKKDEIEIRDLLRFENRRILGNLSKPIEDEKKKSKKRTSG